MIIDFKEDILARRYAQAFLNVYEAECTTEGIQAIQRFEDFFKEYPHMQYLLTLPFIPHDKKRAGLALLQERFQVPQIFNALINVLLNKKRIYLLSHVCQHIMRLYMKRKNIMQCTITSSHILSKEDIETIVNFISKKTDATIHYTYEQDKSLIAGVRVRSATIAWEHSIKKQLQQLQALSID